MASDVIPIVLKGTFGSTQSPPAQAVQATKHVQQRQQALTTCAAAWPASHHPEAAMLPLASVAGILGGGGADWP